jgi:hypothetical protein
MAHSSSLAGSFRGDEVTGISTQALPFSVGGGEGTLVARRLLRGGGEDCTICSAGCNDRFGIFVTSYLSPETLTESKLVRTSSLRQLRKMLYTAAEEGEGMSCFMSTRSRKAGSWQLASISEYERDYSRLQLTMASMRLLVQHTNMLGRLRNLSSAVRSWFVAYIVMSVIL